MSNSKSVWQEIVKDARDRGCYFEASDDKDLSNAVVTAIIELDDAENLVRMDSLHISRPRSQFQVMQKTLLEITVLRGRPNWHAIQKDLSL